MKIKNIILFIFILLLWFLGSFLFKFDPEFYNMLNVPAFALPGKAISISWIVLYILITISIFKVSKKTSIIKSNNYAYTLLTNYISNQAFPLVFFYLKSPFFGFIFTTITFISSIFLYIETKKIDTKASIYLIPYIIYLIYATILSFSVFIMNF